MAVELLDHVGTLRREVIPPGSTLFADVSDEEFSRYLADAFWEARLDGFMSSWRADENGQVLPVSPGGADLPREKIALIVIYAGIRIVRNRLMNLNTTFRASAGPVDYEVRNSANVLTEMLKQLNETKLRLLEQMGGTGVVLVDGLTVRSLSEGSYHGWVHDHVGS